MKILNLNGEDVRILFSREELSILCDSLLEVYQQFTERDFKALIQNISKEDSIELKNSIESISSCTQANFEFLPQNKLIFLVDINKDSFVLQLSYKSVSGISSVLNTLLNEVYLDKEKFTTKVVKDKTKLSSLLHLINFEVLIKMEERIPKFIIHRKTQKILDELNFKRDNLEINSLEQRLKKRCTLCSNNYQFSFLLVSMKNRRVASGIQISIKETSNQIIVSQSYPQLINNYDLIRFISYLELFVESVIQNANLLGYVLPILNSKLVSLLNIKIDSSHGEYEQNQLLKICFQLYTQKHSFEIEDIIIIEEINSFIQSIKTFLSKLTKNRPLAL